MSVKATLRRPNSLNKAMDGSFRYIGNRAWFVGALSYWGHLETARFGARAKEKNRTSCVITASAPTNDHAQIRFCTLWVCKQQNYAMRSRWITVYSPLVNILLRHASIKFNCQ